MTLPQELASIFRSRQKSYKMVLMLSILDEYKESFNRRLPLNQVAERFLSYYRDNSMNEAQIDYPPQGSAFKWSDFTLGQTKSLLKTPIDALSSILEVTPDTISFESHIWDKLNGDVVAELSEYARIELSNYNNQLSSTPRISLQESLSLILNTYIEAKTQQFANHQLGKLFRQSLPEYLKTLSFMDGDYKVQGSIGQGNWANIPWLAILDKRLTTTTQQGEYIVYLFAEDMSAVYLTLLQGVTVPLRERGKRDGYQYFEQKVSEMRELLPLRNLHKDADIHLTASGLGRDYQVSTVAYARYDRNNIPDDDVLIADLENMMYNYKLYADQVTEQQQPTAPPTFKYTMAHLYLGQGIISYLGNNNYSPIPINELVSNQATVLISGDDVKNPKERIQHVGRALQELGQISIEDGCYSLTPQGTEYYLAFDENKWRLSPEQVQLIRRYLGESNGDHATNLAKVMNLAISLVKELGTFSLDEFNTAFISAMGLEEEWGTVTQENRSRFMLNWLEELQFVKKMGDQYMFQLDEEIEPLDTMTVSERLSYIKSFIRNKGFHFPNELIENLYLSLKTKPFVILAGVSGTGKTKLVKLFSEALGALSHNYQFTLIPVRPDWSDPSDLIGYKDLSGAFRPGRLAEVLVEASKPSNRHKPYFICLDEMNLARVEHYFSDLLSIIETQEWQGEAIVTMPLINKDTLAAEDQPVYGNLSLPDNVYLIGTVNMDETTHPFSKKVLDRANTIEFNYINLEQFPDQVIQLNEATTVKAYNVFLRSEYLQLIDAYGEYQELVKQVTAKLVKVNNILEQVHSHVGFRIRDAVCFYMIYNERFSLMGEDEAFDLQLLQKILPRVQGSSSSVKRVLLLLMQEALGKALSVNSLMDDASDLYMKWSAHEPEERAKYPMSTRKIAFMLRRLEEDGFTSYWLS
ncbi:MrcB family domain-containing protein [Paenibacillus sp. NRS-1760]|uniref:MrcB family domain-containing protein n=1 Tax=Paenibacillus sp. NRS-1760 TaxID=3233902 RepID=UPI003D2A3D7B